MTATVLVPALQPHDWQGHGLAVQQPLLGVENPWMPILTFADDSPTTRQLRGDGDAEALRHASSANLAELPYDLGVLRGAELGIPIDVAVLEGHEYAAEQILCEQTMRRVAETLGCRRLVVGIPMRGVLIACDAEAPQQAVGLFLRFVSTKYFEAPYQPLTPLGFLVSDGLLIGAAEGLEESGRAAARPQPAAHVTLALREDTLQVRAEGSLEAKVVDQANHTLQKQLVALALAGRTKPIDVEIDFVDLTEAMLDPIGFAGAVRLTYDQTTGALAAPPLREVRVRCGGELHAAPAPPEAMFTLGLAPIAAMVLVAMTGGDIEDPDVEALLGALQSQPDRLLMQALEGNQLHPGEAIEHHLKTGGAVMQVLHRAGEAAREHLPPERAEAVCAGLTRVGYFVAARRTGAQRPEDLGERYGAAVGMITSLVRP